MRLIATLAICISTLVSIAQQENNPDDGGSFDYGFCGVWESGDVKIDPEMECLDVKNGNMASFKMILMINNGASVKQFEIPGKCLDEKALNALKTAPAGTQVMFSQVKQVAMKGERVDIPGKTFTIVE